MPNRSATGCIAVLIVLVMLAEDAVADNPVLESQAHIREAVAAWEAENYEDAATALETARGLNPESLFSRYALARVYSKLDRTDDALDLLEGLVAQRLDMGFADETDFEALAGHARFEALKERVTIATRPIEASAAHVEMPQHGLMPEGIAADADSGRLFLGSMRTGDVYVLAPTGELYRFAKIGAPGMAAIGLTVDAGRGVLWVASAAFAFTEGFSAGVTRGSALYGFDLASGELRHALRWLGENSNFNDVTVGPDGSVYVSGAGLYKLHENPARLLPVAGTEAIFGGNGLTVHPDGRTLFVSAYPAGLYAVDLPSGESRRLTAPEDVSLYGIDGLYWHDDALLAFQNGARPWRLLRLRVSENRDRVVGSEIIEMANPATTPMTGAILDDAIYYVGEGAQPESLPSHLPAEMAGNAGTVIVRKLPLP